VKNGNEVDGLGNDCADYKSPGGSGDDVGKLDVELLPVVVQPTTVDETITVENIKADNLRGAEKGVEQENNHTSDAVLSEHIHCVVNLDPVLDLDRKIANHTSGDSKDN
jgi:hypothetical protein